MFTSTNATAKDRKSDRVDWFQRKEFEGKTVDEVAKRTLQYLKTKVKRMANEEVELKRMINMMRETEKSDERIIQRRKVAASNRQ